MNPKIDKCVAGVFDTRKNRMIIVGYIYLDQNKQEYYINDDDGSMFHDFGLLTTDLRIEKSVVGTKLFKLFLLTALQA